MHLRRRCEMYQFATYFCSGGPTQSLVGGVYASINKEYVIGVNRNCYRLLGEPAAVYLYFSREKEPIAAEGFLILDLSNTITIRKQRHKRKA